MILFKYHGGSSLRKTLAYRESGCATAASATPSSGIRVNTRARKWVATVENAAAEPVWMREVGPETVTSLLFISGTTSAVAVATETFVAGERIFRVTTVKPCY